MVFRGERNSDGLRVGAKAGHGRHGDNLKVLRVIRPDTERLENPSG